LATTKQTRISVWFFFERYYNSYLPVFPDVILGMSYSTEKIALAVWYGGLKPANGLQILGFGQIVAIVLLALTLMAAIELMDGKQI
jgi:hypothetical protein